MRESGTTLESEEEIAHLIERILDDKKRAEMKLNQGKSFNERKVFSSVPESKQTLIFYMINLVCMIIMCMLVIGVLIIFFVLLIEGSSRLKTSIMLNMIVPALVLILNFYIVTLDEK